jgi:hypothetical protein
MGFEPELHFELQYKSFNVDNKYRLHDERCAFEIDENLRLSLGFCDIRLTCI